MNQIRIVEALEIGEVDRVPRHAITGSENHRIADAIGQAESRRWTALAFVDATIDRIRSQAAQQHDILVEVVDFQAASYSPWEREQLDTQSITER